MLRSLGIAGAAGLGATWGLTYPVGATTAESSVSVTDPVTIESFDGTTLEASFFEPPGAGPHPSILMTHGWGNSRASVAGLAQNYASNGYAVLTYDSRGFGNSGGLVGVDGPNEIRDAQTLISWLADHDAVQNDGPDDPVVGMDGFSYAGGIQLRTAAVDDRLDALVPRWAWHDLRFSNDPNGVLKWPWNYALYVSGLFGSTYGSGVTDAGGDGLPDFSPEFIGPANESIGQGEAPAELRAFWASRSPGPQGELAAIETPTLLIHGWHDRLFTPNEAVANYRGLSDSPGEARLLLYDGGHDLLGAPGDADPAQQAFLNQATLRWFRRHLKDEPVPDDQQLRPVTLYRSDAGIFESYDGLPDAEHRRSLRSAAGRGETTLTTGSGPASAAFDFPVEEELDLTGVGELKLRVSPEGGEPILSAALVEVAADGTETVLKDQVAVTPVERPGVVRLDLIDVEARLQSGQTLRLLVGVDDADLARGLTTDVLYNVVGLPSPAALNAALGPVVPDDIPETDGLYFDSPAGTNLTIHHTGHGESELALATTGANDGPPGRGRGQSDGGSGRGRADD